MTTGNGKIFFNQIHISPGRYAVIQPKDAAVSLLPNLIHMYKSYKGDFTTSVKDKALLAHEVMHQWQINKGIPTAGTVFEILLAKPQVRRKFYNYGSLNKNTNFLRLNSEQQAQLVEDAVLLSEGVEGEYTKDFGQYETIVNVLSRHIPINLGSEPIRLIKTGQQKLKNLGYYHGEVDGRWGPASIDAMRTYASASGLGDPSGKLTRRAINGLNAAPDPVPVPRLRPDRSDATGQERHAIEHATPRLTIGVGGLREKIYDQGVVLPDGMGNPDGRPVGPVGRFRPDSPPPPPLRRFIPPTMSPALPFADPDQPSLSRAHRAIGAMLDLSRGLDDESFVATPRSGGKPVDFWRPEDVEIPVTEAIDDGTTVKGMTPRAIAQLRAAAGAAKAAGLFELRVVAANGGGHKSHRDGTEWDLMGYNADGSKWSREQRVAVAQGARDAGADRFGLYEYGFSRPTADGRLHIGYSGPSRYGKDRPPAMWGAGGRTTGDESRQYANAAERAFFASVNGGTEFDALAHVPARYLTPPNVDASLDAAAYLGGAERGTNGASPVPTALDPGFLPSPQQLSTNQVADVQAILAEQGFDPGPVDGVVGPRTRAAAAAFRAAHGFGNYDAVDVGLARALIDTRPPVTPSEPMNRPEDYIRNPKAGRERLPMLRPPGGAMNPPIPRIDPRRPELVDGPMPMPRVNPMRLSRVPEELPRLDPRRNRDAAPVAAFGTPQVSPPTRMPLPTLRPARAVEGTEPFGQGVPLRPVPGDMLRPRFDDAFASRPAAAGLPMLQQIPDLARDVPRTEALADRFDDAFAPPVLNGAPLREQVPGLPRPVRSTPELTARFDDAFATVPGPGGVQLAGGLGAPPPDFADARLPPGPGAGLNSGSMPAMPPLLSDSNGRAGGGVPGGPSPIPLRDPFGNLDPNKDQSRLPPYDQTNGGEGAYRPGRGKTLDRIADLDDLTAGFDRPELQPQPGRTPLEDGDPDWRSFAGPTQPTRAPQTYDSAPTDIRPQAAGGTGYTNPGIVVAAAPQPAVTPQAAERVWQRVSNIVDSVFSGRGPGGAFNPFNGRSIPPTNYSTPNGFSGAMTSVSGPGPFTGGSNASTYLGAQNWRSPDFNPMSGGSRYPTFTDPASGIGGYVDSQGDVHTYAI